MTTVVAALVFAVLALDKETLMFGALASMIAAGIVVSIGAWLLLRRERRS